MRRDQKDLQFRNLSIEFTELAQCTLINISAGSIHVKMPELVQLLNFIHSPKAGTIKNSYTNISLESPRDITQVVHRR